MKNLICSLVFIFSFAYSQGQTYGIPQNLNNVPNGIVNTNAIKINGATVLGHFTDTTTANLNAYVKYYANGLITTDTSKMWLRNYNATKWLALAVTIDSAGVLIPYMVGVGRTPGTDSVYGKFYNGSHTYAQFQYLDSIGSGGSVIVSDSAWSLTGNSGTAAGTNFIGTIDSVDFVGKTNNTERFRWNARGALAVGSGTDYGTSGYFLKTQGSGTPPIWDLPTNIYNSDGTLTGDRDINGNGSVLDWNNFDSYVIKSNVTLFTDATGNANNNLLRLHQDSIDIYPPLGKLSIDTLNAQANSSDSMLVWAASGSNRGKVGYRAIPTSSGGTVTGTGTAGQLTKWTGTSSIGDATTGTGVLTALGVNTGSAGAFQRNNDGFNGTVGATTPTTGAFTTGTFSGQVTNTTNGAASTPPSRLTGTWFTGGTATTTKPQLLIEPTGTTSTAWSTSGTGLGINAASGFTGNLIDVQLNGVSKVKIRYDGSYFSAGPVQSGYWKNAGNNVHLYGSSTGTGALTVYDGGETGASIIQMGGTGTANPGLFRNGTGIDVKLADNSAFTNISALTTRTTAVAFASLPTGVTGMIATINNSTTNTWGATIAGGGANTVLGFFNGTNWTVIGQ